MPTYVYACAQGHEFEKFQKMSDRQRRARCPQCGGTASRKISGGAGLVFKGSGFYITDYGKGGKGGRRPAADGEGGAEKKESAERKESTERKDATERKESAERKDLAERKESAGKGKPSAEPPKKASSE